MNAHPTGVVLSTSCSTVCRTLAFRSAPIYHRAINDLPAVSVSAVMPAGRNEMLGSDDTSEPFGAVVPSAMAVPARRTNSQHLQMQSLPSPSSAVA